MLRRRLLIALFGLPAVTPGLAQPPAAADP
jgi:hypothetical protein